MRELSLFSGAGGGLLASKLMGWETIGYVEFNNYCQRVIAQRIEDGHIDRAPIFGDIRAFIDQGYAEQYQGVVDVVSGGFPCQPFSVAGKQCAADDPRNMWPATRDVLRITRPRFAFLENVPGLLSGSHGYFGAILRDLAEIGYDARWCVLSAADCGAPHIRKRLWILAYPESKYGRASESQGGTKRRTQGESGDGCCCMADPDSATVERATEPREKRNPWTVEPDVGRVAHGVAARVDRLKAIGNGQVSIVAATAWRILTADLDR